jgi:hypothetical protein
VETLEKLQVIDNDMDAKKARMFLDPGVPQAYYIRDNDLQLIPAPIATASDAIAVLYFYVPDDLTGTAVTGVTPVAVNATDDDLFVNYALWKIYARDRHAPIALKDAQMYEQRYEMRKRRIGSKNRRSGRILPYR